MTTLKEDLADVVSRITVLEEARAAKIRQHLSELSGVIEESYWDVIHPDFYDKAQNLARRIGYIYHDYDEAKTWYYDNKDKVVFFYPSVVLALTFGIDIGIVASHLLGGV